MNDPFDFNPFDGNFFDKINDGLFNRFGFNQEQLLNMYQDAVIKVFRQKVDDLSKELEKMMNPNYNPFRIMGVGLNVTEKGLKEAYRSKAQRYHPDKGGTEEEFKKIQLAYEAIKRMKGWK